MDVGIGELIPKLGVDLVAALSGIDLDAVVPLLEAPDDGEGFAFEGEYALLHGFGIVVSATAGLGALSHAIDERLRGAVEVDEVSHYHLISQSLFELVPVFLVPGEAIEEVPAIAVS